MPRRISTASTTHQIWVGYIMSMRAVVGLTNWCRYYVERWVANHCYAVSGCRYFFVGWECVCVGLVLARWWRAQPLLMVDQLLAFSGVIDIQQRWNDWFCVLGNRPFGLTHFFANFEYALPNPRLFLVACLASLYYANQKCKLGLFTALCIGGTAGRLPSFSVPLALNWQPLVTVSKRLTKKLATVVAKFINELFLNFRFKVEVVFAITLPPKNDSRPLI